ncbi:MAG: hypothetical protein V4648_08805 [Bacteroidota bacterium]
MFQLFKERNFSDYINDTFLFFKVNGKHFFKNYFTINGPFLLIAVVLIFFFMKIYMDFLFSMISGGAVVQENYFGNYFSANLGVIISVLIGALLFFLIISLFQFTFPVVYLDLLDSKKGADFTTKDILIGMKQRIPKILKFVIGAIFILFPIFTIVFGLLVALCFIIVGFPLLFIMAPAMFSFMHLTFYYYMNSEESFFNAIGDAFDTVKGQFWPIVGTTAVMLVIIQIVNTIFTMIPYLFGIASMFTTIESGPTEKTFSTVSIMMSIVMVVSVIVGYILNNLLLINQGMIYYSHIENSESSISNDSIDLIGTDSE